MKYFKTFENFIERELVFSLINRPTVTITVKLNAEYRIESIDNPFNMRFPFQLGERLSRNYMLWACHNNYTINGESACEDEKVFGVRKKDVPQNHPLRIMYPSKFR